MVYEEVYLSIGYRRGYISALGIGGAISHYCVQEGLYLSIGYRRGYISALDIGGVYLSIGYRRGYISLLGIGRAISQHFGYVFFLHLSYRRGHIPTLGIHLCIFTLQGCVYPNTGYTLLYIYFIGGGISQHWIYF